jgi:hypothetical protein
MRQVFLLVSRAESGGSGTVFRSHLKNGKVVNTLHVHNDYNNLRVGLTVLSIKAIVH